MRIDLRAVFYQQDGLWVAHCLEMDVVGTGKTKDDAFELMHDAICTQVLTSIEHNASGNIFMPADSRFFEMYALGKDTASGQLQIKKKDYTNESDCAPIQSIESREFALA